MRFTKGHGTENDFVLLTDPTGEVDLDPVTVARLCDRHAGIGADGILRVVRSAATPESDGSAEWFMDHRNADGSTAEMCGNGIRVYVAHLLREGLLDVTALDDGLAVATRSGVKTVRRDGESWLAVDMGPWRLADGDRARGRGYDALVEVAGLGDVARPGLSLDLGNPHTVVAVSSVDELLAADLTRPPAVDPVPTHGTNVELVLPLDSDDSPDGPIGRLRMRVHERGVGETRSCGTGACAAALAARTWAGEGAPTRWLVDVPGGTVGVRLLPSGSVELSGPAVLVADGELDDDWIADGT